MKIRENVKRYSCMFMAATLLFSGIPATVIHADEISQQDLDTYTEASLPEDHIFGTNVALGKTVTTKIQNTNSSKNNIVDGNDNSHPDITTPNDEENRQQYYIVDLGKDYVIDCTKICWRDTGYASEYQIQVATEASVEEAGAVNADGVTWTTVAEETNYVLSGDKEEKEYTFDPISVRYVKLNCTSMGNKESTDFYHVREFSVYTVGSKEIGDITLDTSNMVIDENAQILETKSSTAEANCPNENLIDGDEGTSWSVGYWTSDGQSQYHFLLDLGTDKTFDFIKLVPGERDRWAKHYQFFVATEEEGVDAVSKQTGSEAIYEEKYGERTVQYCALGTEVTARYVLFKCVANNASDTSGIALNEIELYNIADVEPTELIVAPTSMELTEKKSTGQISTMINPVTASKQTMEYSSANEAVATVDETGYVTGVAAGETVITAKIKDTNISKEMKVTVRKAIPKATNVTATLANKLAKDVTVSWSAVSEAESYIVRRFKGNNSTGEDLATVTGTTYIDSNVASGNYTYQIIAKPKDTTYSEESTSSRTSSVVIAIDPVSITGQELSLNVSDTKSLKVVLDPTDTTYDDIAWSIVENDGVIELDAETGKVTGLKVGTAKVKATLTDYPNLTTTCTVTVGKVAVEGISLTAPGITDQTMGVGEEATLTATVTPTDATYQDLSWTSSNENVVIVTQDGTVAAIGEGTATITVTSVDDASISATYDITVIQKNTEKVTLNAVSKTLVLNEEFQLTATVTPDTVEDKTVTWKSSAEQYAVVDSNGKVTAKGVGEAIITATCGSVSSSCKITVERPAPEQITITSSGIMSRMTVGEEISLRISVKPATADMGVTWSSSDPDIATIDENGTVTAVSAGTVTITAKAAKGDQTATLDITVEKPPITDMYFNDQDKNITMILDDVRVLKPVILPEDAEQKVTYTCSRDGVITIDEDGNVTAVGVGTVKVTATSLDEYYEESVTITVKKPAVEQIVLNHSSTVRLEIGGILDVGAITLPEKAENAVSYTSSNPAIATVNANGRVSAVAEGEATIVVSATDGSGKTASFKVIVSKPQVAGLTLDQSELTLNAGATAALRATVTPATANQAVNWTSSNPAVASVDASGNVTALTSGTAVITVTTADGTKAANCTVTVKIPATKLTLNTKKIYLVKGKSVTIKGVMTPANTTDTITWKTGNKKVATVSSKGKIKAKKVGNTTITATTTSGKKVTCKVYVVKKATASKSIKLNKKKVTIKKGSWVLLSPTLSPSKSTDTIKWKSSKKKVASVDKYGFVTAKKKGTAVITATTKSGKKVQCKVTVK